MCWLSTFSVYRRLARDRWLQSNVRVSPVATHPRGCSRNSPTANRRFDAERSWRYHKSLDTQPLLLFYVDRQTRMRHYTSRKTFLLTSRAITLSGRYEKSVRSCSSLVFIANFPAGRRSLEFDARPTRAPTEFVPAFPLFFVSLFFPALKKRGRQQVVPMMRALFLFGLSISLRRAR